MSDWLYALDGKRFPLVRVGDDAEFRQWDDGRCHGCNQETGEPHVPGCDSETCPRCGGQMMSCNCEHEERPYMEEIDVRLLIKRLQLALGEQS